MKKVILAIIITCASYTSFGNDNFKGTICEKLSSAECERVVTTLMSIALEDLDPRKVCTLESGQTNPDGNWAKEYNCCDANDDTQQTVCELVSCVTSSTTGRTFCDPEL